LRQGGLRPEPKVLAAAREGSGAALIYLDPQAGTVQMKHPAAGLEEGGFLKGYALDRMKAAAQAEAGLLDFGGQLLAWGPATRAAIADPRDRQRAGLSLDLQNASLSTSGTSERGRHILDPRTGQPCEAWGAVAVVAPTGLEADILSTALYVLGPDAGLAFAEREAIAAAFLIHGGETRLSSAFQSLHPVHLKEQP
jgi:thiamine biosynthesis lipoprotein